jgi:hypothetical protein
MWFIKRGKRSVTLRCGSHKARLLDRDSLAYIGRFNGRSFKYGGLGFFFDEDDLKSAREYMRNEWLKEPHNFEPIR